MDFVSKVNSLYGAKCYSDFPLKDKTAFKSGGNCKYFIEIKSLRALQNALEMLGEENIPYYILGGGSNLIVSDKGYSGAVISTLALNGVFVKEDKLFAMAGARLPEIYRFALENSLSGLEELSSIPGTLGGAVYMNAGAFGRSFSDIIYSVETISDGKIKKYYKGDCKFAYRKSIFQKNNEIILSASLDLKSGEKGDITATKTEYDRLRRLSQPCGRTFGSVFKNPKGYSAAKLIEGANLKGVKVGGAKVSDKHANFIINEDGCTTKDALDLIKYIKRSVYNKYGITLKEEVKYLGNIYDT